MYDERLWDPLYRRAIHPGEVVERYLDGWLDWHTLVILRGMPGSGKSTLAWSIESACRSVGFTCQVCSADDHFTDQFGVYRWNRDELSEAHRYCETAFERAMRTDVPVVVIDNTNLDVDDYARYTRMARQLQYRIVVVEFVLRCLDDAPFALRRSNVEDADAYRLEQRLTRYAPDNVNESIQVEVAWDDEDN
jgi:predicted kinase